MSEHGPGHQQWSTGGEPVHPGPAAGGWQLGGPAPTGWGPAAPPWPGQPGPPPAGARSLVPALVAAVVVAVGVVVAAVLGALVLGASADDLGRAIGESSADAMAAEMDSGGVLGWSAAPPEDPRQIEQSEPVAPGELGNDAVLDGYADACFGGDLQACDDLYTDSKPLSAYEHYALTCGGRVKAFDVSLCTDLD
jgi:hypothetical protein